MTLNIYFLFLNKHIYNRHINKIKKTKRKIHITVVSYNSTVTTEVKLKRSFTKLMDCTWFNFFSIAI